MNIPSCNDVDWVTFLKYMNYIVYKEPTETNLNWADPSKQYSSVHALIVYIRWLILEVNSKQPNCMILYKVSN